MEGRLEGGVYRHFRGTDVICRVIGMRRWAETESVIEERPVLLKEQNRGLHRRGGCGAEAGVAEIKLPPGAGAVITNCNSGSGY
jgi:hypothetical protein